MECGGRSGSLRKLTVKHFQQPLSLRESRRRGHHLQRAHVAEHASEAGAGDIRRGPGVTIGIATDGGVNIPDVQKLSFAVQTAGDTNFSGDGWEFAGQRGRHRVHAGCGSGRGDRTGRPDHVLPGCRLRPFSPA